jgi:hypothetical protein
VTAPDSGGSVGARAEATAELRHRAWELLTELEGQIADLEREVSRYQALAERRPDPPDKPAEAEPWVEEYLAWLYSQTEALGLIEQTHPLRTFILSLDDMAQDADAARRRPHSLKAWIAFAKGLRTVLQRAAGIDPLTGVAKAPATKSHAAATRPEPDVPRLRRTERAAQFGQFT